MRSIDNLQIDDAEGTLVVKVNPRFYPLEVIYSASYALLDRAYVVLDGDPQQEILVKLRPLHAGASDLERLGREFNNELLNYTMYAIQVERNKAVRDAIIQRALLTSTGPGTSGEPSPAAASVSPAEMSYKDDPLAINKPARAAGKKATGAEGG